MRGTVADGYRWSRSWRISVIHPASAAMNRPIPTRKMTHDVIKPQKTKVVPIAKPAPTILSSQVQANVPDGLDCSNIDWRSQLRANLNTGMSMAEIKQVGQNALAASTSYLMAALRPTYFETVQNIQFHNT